MLTQLHDKELLRIKQVASEVDVHPSTVRRAIHNGHLEAVRLGKKGPLRIPRASLDEFLVPAQPTTTEGDAS